MRDVFKLQGAWIDMNAEVHFTQNIQSHATVIRELNLQPMLEKEQKLRNLMKYDLSQVAMLIGFIRVTNYRNQFGIEYGSKVTFAQILSILNIYRKYAKELWSNAREKICSFTIENFITNQCQTFTDTESFSNALDSLQ